MGLQPQGWKSSFSNPLRELICGSSTFKRLIDKPEWQFTTWHRPDPYELEKQEQRMGLGPFCPFRPCDEGLAVVFLAAEERVGMGGSNVKECLRWCKIPRVAHVLFLGKRCSKRNWWAAGLNEVKVSGSQSRSGPADSGLPLPGCWPPSPQLSPPASTHLPTLLHPL